MNMANSSNDNCGNCAYVDKSGKQYWCPFLDLPVTERNICDNYLAEFESPQWTALAQGMNGTAKKEKQYLPKDIFMYIVTYILLLIAVAVILICFYAPL